MTVTELHPPPVRDRDADVAYGRGLLDAAFLDGQVLGRVKLARALGEHRSPSWARKYVLDPWWADMSAWHQAEEEAQRQADANSAAAPPAILEQPEPVTREVPRGTAPAPQRKGSWVSAAFDWLIGWYLMGTLAALSYEHVRTFVERGGVHGWKAHLLAGTVDVLAYRAYTARHYGLLAFSVAASLAANLTVAPFTGYGYVSAAWCPVALVLVHWLKERKEGPGDATEAGEATEAPDAHA